MTNLLELIKKQDNEIDDYLMNVDIDQFKADIEALNQNQQTSIDKKIDQLSSQIGE